MKTVFFDEAATGLSFANGLDPRYDWLAALSYSYTISTVRVLQRKRDIQEDAPLVGYEELVMGCEKKDTGKQNSKEDICLK